MNKGTKGNDCFWGHKWGPWKKIEDKKLVLIENNALIGWCIKQERICEACGKTELDVQSKFL